MSDGVEVSRCRWCREPHESEKRYTTAQQEKHEYECSEKPGNKIAALESVLAAAKEEIARLETQRDVAATLAANWFVEKRDLKAENKRLTVERDFAKARQLTAEHGKEVNEKAIDDLAAENKRLQEAVLLLGESAGIRDWESACETARALRAAKEGK